jgi:PAP2 superfamily
MTRRRKVTPGPANRMPRLVRLSSAVRVAAWSVVAAGVAVPLVRKRARIPPPVVTASAAAAPFALSVALSRSVKRDVALVVLQMYAYTVTYQMPNDDPEALERRVHLDYPVRIDRILGLGEMPNVRLQRWFAVPGKIRKRDQALVWFHWLWFLFPHGTVAYVLWRHPDRFPRTAALTYAVFDLGLIGYWAVPTAPPWYASLHGRLGESGDVAIRRMMVEHGEAFWRDSWEPLYSVLGGNPLAAMPSLHFATSLMAAHLLTEAGPVEGAVGWTYALTLGFALVYLGEHYLIDLLVGATLTESVRGAAPVVAPAVSRVGRLLQRLERLAHP